MVSIRRRKLLGLCSGRSSFLAQVHNSRSFIVHPIPSVDLDESKERGQPGLSNTSTSSSSKEKHKQLADPRFRAEGATGEEPIRKVPEVKRRKRHKRKHIENQEPCVMRGVYYKNMKWQAAIKVDKKQIHLGTCGSQEEAARLYDRAAFMCAREPNFELSKEDKQELRELKWDEFLALTRSAITNKRHQRRSGVGLRRKFEAAEKSSDWEEGDQGVGL